MTDWEAIADDARHDRIDREYEKECFVATVWMTVPVTVTVKIHPDDTDKQILEKAFEQIEENKKKQNIELEYDSTKAKLDDWEAVE